MILKKKQFIVSGVTLLFVLTGLLVASFMFGERSKPALVSANGQLSCDSEQYKEYNKYMVVAGEMTIGQQLASGTRQEQQKMIDAFEALSLPKDRTVIAAGHFPTGKLYTTICEKERCTFDEMGSPARACMDENWGDCPYLAMQFREKTYCLLSPSDQ